MRLPGTMRLFGAPQPVPEVQHLDLLLWHAIRCPERLSLLRCC